VRPHTFRYLVTVPPEPGATVLLSQADTHHLVRVVRRRPGDDLELIDGTGRLWPAVLVAEGPPAAVVVAEPRPAPPSAPVTLYQGLAEWGRLDVLVEKAAELGLARVAFFSSGRVRRLPDADAWRRRRGRLLRVAEAGARQAGRGGLPRIDGLLALDDVLAEVAADGGYLLDPGGAVPLGAALDAAGRASHVALVIGPEAGFSPDELRAAGDAGLVTATLGPAVLRAETAALVALSLALAAVGRFGGDGD
jgi:16S rRNA (uracil1498-N3)-methyltransferase